MPKHLNGAVQGVCSSAIGLATLLLAFIGFVGYTGKHSGDRNWEVQDLWYLIPAGIAFFVLALVPFVATARQDESETPMAIARWILLCGTGFALFALLAFFWQDVSNGFAARK